MLCSCVQSDGTDCNDWSFYHLIHFRHLLLQDDLLWDHSFVLSLAFPYGWELEDHGSSLVLALLSRYHWLFGEPSLHIIVSQLTVGYVYYSGDCLAVPVSVPHVKVVGVLLLHCGALSELGSSLSKERPKMWAVLEGLR